MQTLFLPILLALMATTSHAARIDPSVHPWHPRRTRPIPFQGCDAKKGCYPIANPAFCPFFHYCDGGHLGVAIQCQDGMIFDGKRCVLLGDERLRWHTKAKQSVITTRGKGLIEGVRYIVCMSAVTNRGSTRLHIGIFQNCLTLYQGVPSRPSAAIAANALFNSPVNRHLAAWKS